MKIDVGRRNTGKNPSLEKPLQHRRTQLNRSLMIDARDHFRKRQPGTQRRNQKYKSRQRPRHSNIEKDALAVNRRTDADESPQRPRKRRWRGQEKRQCGVHSIVHTRQIVSQFVRHQDGQQRQRKRQPREEQLRTAQPHRENIEVRSRSKNGRLWLKLYCMCAPTSVVVNMVATNSRKWSHSRVLGGE